MDDTLLIVEDDTDLRQHLREFLGEENFRCQTAADGTEALERLEQTPPDLVLLDVMLPDIGGRDLLPKIRRRRDVPVIYISGRDDVVDRVVGLELGADDYVTKPFDPRELVARIRAVLRRTRSETSSDEARPADPTHRLTRGDIVLYPEQFRVVADGTEIDLTKTEFRLMKALMERPQKVFSRRELIDNAYEDAIVSDQTIDSHVRHIRQKFDSAGRNPIATVRGVGYSIA